MKITKTVDGNKLTLKLAGKPDMTSGPQPEEYLKDALKDVVELEFDFEELVYISSAGLRALLSAQKTMNRQGSMVIKNANEIIMEVFDLTGFFGSAYHRVIPA